MSKTTFILGLTLVACSSPLWALRIVSLLPSDTEILDSIGAGADVVGVTRFDKFAKHPGVENIGDFVQPSMEKIVALRPELIVAGHWNSSHTVPQLKKMGYRVLEVSNPSSLEEIYESIRVLSTAVGRPAAAEPVITQMQQRLKAVQARARALPRRLRTYIEIDRPFWTVGGHDFLTEALVIAGADNLFSDMKQQAAQVSPEIIIQRDPELILSFEAKRAEIANRSGWSALKAVQSGFIIDDLSQDDLARPSPRLVDGIEALLSRIERLEKR